MLVFDRPRTPKTKDELKEIAELIVEALKKESLPIWQAKEVLLYAKGEIDRQALN